MLMKLERVKGIEPSYTAWEAVILPLNYTRFQNNIFWDSLVSLYQKPFNFTILNN